MNKRRSVGAMLAAMGLIVAACGGDDDGGQSDSTDAADSTDASADDTTADETDPAGSGAPAATGAQCEETVPDSRINFGTYATTQRIDPTLTSGGLVGGHEIAAVYDVLFRFDFDTNEYVPQLAESITPNDDFTVWTLSLREGITYSDGTPLTAEVVAGNFERFFAEGAISTGSGFLAPVSESKVIDDLTLEITLKNPWQEFPFVLANSPGMVVNPNAIGDDLDAFAAQPPDAAGLGPYVVERNAPGEELVMTARDDYWGGPVCVETLRFVNIPGAQATYDAFSNEELDVAFLRDPGVIEQAEADGYEGEFIQQDSGDAILLNQAEGRPGVDPLVREAIALAIDPEVVSERAYGGDLNASSALIQEGSRFNSEDIESVPHDPERAQELVDEAKANGFDGTIDLACQSAPPAPDRALAIEGMLNAVGIEVNSELLPQTDLISEVVTGNYEAACWGVSAGPDTAVTALERNFRSDAASNRIGYQSEEMDAALDDLMLDTSPETMAALNQIYIEDHPMVSIGAIEEGSIWQSDVTGVLPTASSVFLFHDAYVDDTE